MKKLLTLLVNLGLGYYAKVSCPDEQAHKDAIMAVVNESINDELNIKEGEGNFLSNLASSIGSGVAGVILDNRLTVKDNFLFSVGEIKNADGESKAVSYGVFGHVFTVDKDEVVKAFQ